MEIQTVVFDTSTLILLAKCDLLQSVAEKAHVVIPPIVKEEALAKPDAYDAQLIHQMLKDGKIQLGQKGSKTAVKTLQKQLRLDAGEAVALSVAKEQGWILGMDVGPGIRAAKILGVPFLTAVHVLLGLFEQRILDTPSALAKLDALQVWGRYQVPIIENARSRIQKEGEPS